MPAFCPDHPTRAATAPCRRCGRFLCDWCEKLAPSWGPGLCGPCQATVGAVPAARQLGGWLSLFASWLLVSVFGPFIELREVYAAGAWTAWILGVAALNAALLIATLGILVLFARRKRAAPKAIGVYLIVRFANGGLNLAAMATQGAGVGLLAVGALWELTTAAWIAYFLRSPRVAETFVL